MEQTAERVYSGPNPFLLDRVPEGRGTVLDIGCGAGGNAERLSARGKIVDGITLSPQEADLASAWCRTVLLHNLELGIPDSLQGPYDLCVCCHVIEHVCNPTPLLDGVRRVLAPDGVFLVVLPNLLQHRNRWNICRGRFEYEDTGIMDSTHVRWYTWESGKRLLEAHGFHVEDQVASGNFPLSKLRRILPQTVSGWIDSNAVRQFPGLFGYQFLYRARPARKC